MISFIAIVKSTLEFLLKDNSFAFNPMKYNDIRLDNDDGDDMMVMMMMNVMMMKIDVMIMNT